jgi:hypothetical protein
MAEALARLRAKKAAAASGDGGVAASSSGGDNKRSDLKKLRETARGEESSGETGQSKLAALRQRLNDKTTKANPLPGNFLLIYLCNFHVLSHLLLIYICILHWNHNKDDDEEDDEDDDKDMDEENDKTLSNAQTKTEVSDDAEEISIVNVALPPHLFPLTFAPQVNHF